ncbi:MAG: lysozyme inhibitor LprI family protein [Stellaceae bacterium]
MAAPASAQADPCDNLKSQPELNECAQREYLKTDAELNRLYRQLRQKIGDAALLAASERAWIAYRDRECEFETDGDAGGSIRPMHQADCLKAKTVARNAELRQLLKCWEDASSCPY